MDELPLRKRHVRGRSSSHSDAATADGRVRRDGAVRESVRRAPRTRAFASLVTWHGLNRRSHGPAVRGRVKEARRRRCRIRTRTAQGVRAGRSAFTSSRLPDRGLWRPPRDRDIPAGEAERLSFSPVTRTVPGRGSVAAARGGVLIERASRSAPARPADDRVILLANEANGLAAQGLPGGPRGGAPAVAARSRTSAPPSPAFPVTRDLRGAVW